MSAPERFANGPRARGRAGGRGIAWARRRAAAGAVWREFVRNKAGVIGLVALLAIVLLAVTVPWWTPEDALSVTRAPGAPVHAPDGDYWLGTDKYGRSVLLLTVWGARVSLLVGFAAAALSVIIGTVVGMLAAHFGGWVSGTLLRITDFFLVLPALVMAMVLSAMLERGLSTIVLAIGVTSWASTARLVRAQTLTIEARPYIERARALGGGHLHVMTRHVLPAVLPLVLANTTLMVGNAIIAESTLAFLGLGDPTKISWGGTLQFAMDSGAVTAGAWWWLLPPGAAIAVVVLCFTLCGRALEVVLNPNLRTLR